MWEDYIDPQHKNLLLEGAEELRHINAAVQQDIQDKIITEGLINPPEHNRGHNKGFRIIFFFEKFGSN